MDAPRGAAPSSSRIASIDLIRGAVMVLMAIDHVRVYSGLPAGGPTAGIFFTRWITHFVAPGFCFFAGTGAFFLGRKVGDPRALARFLVTRGLLLVLLELTVIRLSWTFNLDYAHYVLAGVIWMLGWCMVLLAGLVRFSPRAVGVFGLTVIFFQDLFGALGNVLPSAVGRFLYFGGDVQLGSSGPTVAVLYVIVPWIGVMAAGYGFGAILLLGEAERRRWCLRIGLAATAAFVVIAGLMVLLRPAPADAPPALFRFLGQRKYPASQLFLLMTLGPMIALLPLAERARGRLARAMTTFGRVPLFFYLLHIPLIHAAALVVSLLREGRVDSWLIANHPMWSPPLPQGYQWSLPLLYLVWAVVVALLYVACRWYADLKVRRTDWWLRYL
jgi:uncharacterized membrane protein